MLEGLGYRWKSKQCRFNENCLLSTMASNPPGDSFRVLSVRGHTVVLDSDLAKAYGVSARQLNQQVKRNSGRFPDDFVFRLNRDEWKALLREYEIARRHGGRRHVPYVFTEVGVAMVASVL